MRLVTLEEYEELKPIIEKEMGKLAKHENKNLFRTNIAINSCYVRNISDNIQLFQAYSPGIIRILDEEYPRALKENPECFGTNNAKDVIHALYIQAQKNNYVYGEERYTKYLSTESFCLLLSKIDGTFSDNIFRIDLFRKIEKSTEHPGCYDFTGGIFHALKHFSIDEQCASILPNQNVSLYSVEQLLWPIAKAFYEENWNKGKKAKTYETSIDYQGKMFILEFFKEDDSNVAFLNTTYPKRKKKEKQLFSIQEKQFELSTY